jgi:hypothetical protein
MDEYLFNLRDLFDNSSIFAMRFAKSVYVGTISGRSGKVTREISHFVVSIAICFKEYQISNE